MSSNPDRVVFGEITGAHGLRGEVRVRIAGDGPDGLLALESVWLGRTPSDPEARRYVVRGRGRGREGELRLQLEGVGTREAAQALVGRLVCAPADVLPALPEGEFYWHELIGCRVESETGRVVGQVRELWETGAHDVMVVEDEDGARRLIPTAGALMRQVDLDARRIVVADLPGLLEPI